MRTIGLIGGMSWASSASYYRLINEGVARRLGGHHNARSVMYTVDFAGIERRQREGDWDGQGEILADAARRVVAGGAELLALCTNTMHLVADRITAAVDVPFVHIVDATARDLRRRGIERVGLLGTRFTMENGFYTEHMARLGIDVIVPGDDDRGVVHNVIYSELTRNVVTDESRDAYRTVIARLADRGADGVVLGCTEIGLLVGPDDATIPVVDATVVHAEAIVDAALADATG